MLEHILCIVLAVFAVGSIAGGLLYYKAVRSYEAERQKELENYCV